MDSSLVRTELGARHTEKPLTGVEANAAILGASKPAGITHARGSLICLHASPSRTVAGCVGPLLLGLGSGISISAGFGSFGFSVLLDGIHRTFDQPLWLTQLVMTLLMFAIAWRWAGIQLGIGSIPALLLIGPAISLGATFTPENVDLAGHILAFAIGLFFFALGISLSAAAALGPDGVTALSLAAEKRHFLAVPKATFLWNFLAIVSGSVLGGNWGIASIVGLLGVPIIIHFLLPWLRSHVVN